MGRSLLLYIFLFYWHFLNALFTVEAPQSLCIVERGNNVTMECTFPVNGKLEFRDLSVSWEKKDELKQVYVLHKGEEDFKNQHIDFRGRIKLLKEKLNLGQSLLQISDVKLRDAGVYRCVIAYGGADYKTIHLKVKAPYRIINQGVVSTGHNEWELTCQSEGYPEAEVIWQNRNYEDLTDKANTRSETGSDQLYRVTSTLTIKSGIGESFYCIFWNKELQENTSAILHIADSTDGILQTESRRFVRAALLATAFVGSGLLFLFCIRKARENKGNRTPLASSSMAKLSKDKDTQDCRDASFEDRELKFTNFKPSLRPPSRNAPSPGCPRNEIYKRKMDAPGGDGHSAPEVPPTTHNLTTDMYLIHVLYMNMDPKISIPSSVNLITDYPFLRSPFSRPAAENQAYMNMYPAPSIPGSRKTNHGLCASRKPIQPTGNQDYMNMYSEQRQQATLHVVNHCIKVRPLKHMA